MNQQKILIIEDDESIGKALTTVLEFEGYSTKFITQARQALRIVRAYKPNIIILDFLLSGVDGRQVARAIKKNSEYAKIPIIMTSAHPTAEKAAHEAGVQSFIAKPFDINNLIEKLKFFLCRQKYSLSSGKPSCIQS